ncbi:Immunoglobulin superfamily containing leucine-rich repeat protein [Camponotus floridanus]|uniref:Immunoglobulin superfamily containing leucine-rich repeat protein n=1 Tax=Camponotus floridanus TaxID=104421 RepID=E2AJM8_CAMFO|nr:Immunoglobulin superfamily containing leucine-rich repeat protein [Camponotus floridanus]
MKMAGRCYDGDGGWRGKGERGERRWRRRTGEIEGNGPRAFPAAYPRFISVDGLRNIRASLVKLVHSTSEKCPLLCDCDIWYGLQSASCVGRHLYSIHTGVPSTVQALDLSNNSISILNNYELADAGLLRLKYLNLSTNAISEIGLNAFDRLSELTVLDLSQNHLYYLLSDIFISAKNLRILRLSKNNFNSQVPKLKNSWLTKSLVL